MDLSRIDRGDETMADKVLAMLGTKNANVVIYKDRDASFFRAYKGHETKDFKTRTEATQWIQNNNKSTYK